METFYQVNRSAPIYPELRGLLMKTAGAADVLRAGLTGLADKIEIALIYGSVARGAETADSDVDILIIGQAGLGELVSALKPAQDQLHREVNPVIFTATEIRERLALKDRFLTTILEHEKVFLIGDQQAIERMGTVRMAD